MDQNEWEQKWDELHRIATKTESNVGSDEPLLDAYLYVSRVRCGRATCKCMQTGYRHEKWCLSFMENGRSRTLTVPDGWLERIAAATRAYRETRVLIRQLGAGAEAAVGTANKRLAKRVTVGRQLLAKLIAAKVRRRKETVR
jgi:hypothetical protein